MEPIKHFLTIDLLRQTVNGAVYIRNGGVGHVIAVTLTRGREVMELPGELEGIVQFCYQKPGADKKDVPMTVVGKSASCLLPRDATDEVGEVECEVRVYQPDILGTWVTTPKFKLAVEAVIYDPTTQDMIENDPTVYELICASEAERRRMEAERQAAEEARAAAEAERQAQHYLHLEDVEDDMSMDSVYPVQNRVITAALATATGHDMGAYARKEWTMDKLADKVDYDDLDAYAPKSAVGAPLTAATAAQMTDHNRIYVYVGEEEGYTAGDWYYWDGSEWASGGVYNSTAFDTDTTLKIAGMAADAKATGDMLQTALKMAAFTGEKEITVDGQDITQPHLGNQPANTVCRLHNIGEWENVIDENTGEAVDLTPQGATRTWLRKKKPYTFVDDAPEGVDLYTYYGWLYTVGSTNKHQYLFYSHDKRLYHRYTYGVGSGQNATTEWSDWMVTDDRDVKYMAFDGEKDDSSLPPVDVINPATGSAVRDADTGNVVQSMQKRIKLSNQPENTVCRLSRIELPEGQTELDVPNDVDVLLHTEPGAANHYAWLYTFGGANMHQMLYDASSTRLYQRFANTVSGVQVWGEWHVVNENAVRQVGFIGKTTGEQAEIDPDSGEAVMRQKTDPDTGDPVFDPDTGDPVMEIVTEEVEAIKLGWQPVNTVCRLYRVGYTHQEDVIDPATGDPVIDPDTGETKKKTVFDGQADDVPAGVDLYNYYGWMLTVGGVNKMQYLVDAHTKGIYFRFFTGVTQKRPTGWTDWFTPTGSGGGGGGSGEKKELRIMILGNSFDQDSMAYVPPILNEILPDYDITYCVMYIGSSTIQDHLDLYNKTYVTSKGNNLQGHYPFLNIWKPGATKWSRKKTSDANPLTNIAPTLQEMLDDYDWDIILLQPETDDVMPHDGHDGTYHRNLMLRAARKLLRKMQTYVQQNGRRPFGAALLEWMPKPYPGSSPTHTSEQVYEAIHSGIKTGMRNVGFMDYIPIGTAFQNARTTSLNELGSADYGQGAPSEMVYSDETHMQAGIPALLSAYTIALKILEWTGNRHRGIYGSAFVPTDARCKAINALSISWDAALGETHVAGMTHGLSALGSSETTTFVYDGSHSVTVEAETDGVRDKIALVQEIAVRTVERPDEVIDCSPMEDLATGAIQEIEPEDCVVTFELNEAEGEIVYTADKSIEEIFAAGTAGKNVYAKIPLDEDGTFLRMDMTICAEGSVTFGAVIADEDDGSMVSITSALVGVYDEDEDEDVWIPAEQAESSGGAEEYAVTFTQSNGVFTADKEIPDIVSAAENGSLVFGYVPMGLTTLRLPLSSFGTNYATFGCVQAHTSGGTVSPQAIALEGQRLQNADQWTPAIG